MKGRVILYTWKRRLVVATGFKLTEYRAHMRGGCWTKNTCFQMNIVQTFTSQKQYWEHMKCLCILSLTKVNGIYLNTLIPKLCCHQNTSDLQEGQRSNGRSHLASLAKGRVPILVVHVDSVVIIGVHVELQHGMHRNWYIPQLKCSFT